MKCLLEILNLSVEFLSQHGFERARREAEDLFSLALGLKRLDLYLHHDRPLSAQELEKLRRYLKRRSKNEPLAYIHGEQDFFSCRLHITPDALIPRQETEILCHKIYERLKVQDGMSPKVLVDMCTGSGCLAIALKKALPSLRVIACDLSPKALALAAKNAALNQVSVEFCRSDLFASFSEDMDYFVCNPPYVARHEWEGLDCQVRNFEPREALLGGVTGREFYERISRVLPRLLRPKGCAFFEIGASQGSAVAALFEGGGFARIELQTDYSGRERFLFLEKD